MSNKSQELELRNIMQGLEEFATFMSYQSNSLGLRIISVESIEQDFENSKPQHKADVLAFKQRIPEAEKPDQQSLQRSLAFQDRLVH
jgi:hypothetical protein